MMKRSVKCCNTNKLSPAAVTPAWSSNLKLASVVGLKKNPHILVVTGQQSAIQDILKFIPIINKCKLSFPPTLPLFTFYTKPISLPVFILTEDFLSSSFCPPCKQPSPSTSEVKKKKFFGPSNTAAILDVSLFQGRWTWAREGERGKKRGRLRWLRWAL